jgi:hypothetical protein
MSAMSESKPKGTEVRCDEIVAHCVVRTYVDGVPTGEQVSQPIKWFRGTTPDVWAEVDRAVDGLRKQARPRGQGSQERARRLRRK